MAAILFGSIGTIADTSELQRRAFNEAFKAEGLDWNWSREDYLEMLEKSGGQQRIDDYARAAGQAVNVKKIHQLKSEIFQRYLSEDQLPARPGVSETMQAAKKNGLKLALVTTTSEKNVSSLIEALRSSINAADFDVIVNASHVARSKPAEDAYVFALEQLGERPDSCVAIEDNLGGVEAAQRAEIDCVAFPNENTAHHDFARADALVNRLDFDALQQLIMK